MTKFLLSLLFGVIVIQQGGGGGPTLVESDDFEAASEDVPSGCAGSSKVDTVGGTPVCDFTGVIIAGSESLEIGTADFVEYDFTRITSGTVEFRAKVYPNVGGGAGSAREETLQLEDGTTFVAAIECQDDGATDFSCVCRSTDNTSTASSSIAGDTAYNFCLRYDVDNDDAECYIDADGGTWCSGSTGPSWSATADDTTGHTGLDDARLDNGSNSSAIFIYDAMELYDNG